MRERYEFHGLALEVDSELAGVGEAIAGRLRRFAAPPAGEAGADIAFAYRGGSPQDGAPGGRIVYESPAGEVRYRPEQDAFVVLASAGPQVLAHPERGDVTVWTADAATDVWLLSRPLFTLPLIEALKRRERYSLHASCVAVDGVALVFPGASGSGKSTLSLALARAGHPFMADDMVFLGPGEPTVHAFPDEIDLTADSLALLPEVAPFAIPPSAGFPKHRIRPDAALSPGPLSAPAGAVLFPAVDAEADPGIEPMSAAEAVVGLAPNVLLTEPASSQAHLDALQRLATGVPCFRLTVGRDLARVEALLAGLVASLRAGP